MSHFTVLTAVNMPSDIRSDVQGVPDQAVTKHIMEEYSLSVLSAKPGDPIPHIPDITDQQRLEVLVENLIEPVLEPYCENTDDPDYLEFEDRTDEGQQEYDTGRIDCVKMPNGSIIPSYYSAFSRIYELHEGMVYKSRFGPLHQRKRTSKAKRIKVLPDYPLKRLFPDFKTYMREYEGCGLDEKTGRYGYWHNPNSQWDWYQIGGRWPFRFLVKEDCPYAVSGEISRVIDPPEVNAPDGYRWVAGARKRDIAWDVMRTFYQERDRKKFSQYEEWFRSGQIPEEYRYRIELTEDGIKSWGDFLYRADETLDEYFIRSGISDQDIYPIGTYACLDKATGWHSVGEMGWFGISSNEKDDDLWKKEVHDFIAGQPDDAMLVSVDCHI